MKKILITLLIIMAVLNSCKENKGKENPIEKKVKDNWEMVVKGKKTELFTLKNNNNIIVTITNYGGKVVSLHVPDSDGKFEDIVLGYDNIEETVNGDPYFGAIIGRFGNRIAKGKFTVDGKVYTLNKNLGNHTIHGGKVGYNNVVFDAKQKGNKLILKHFDSDMHEGYPGNLDVTVIYELTDDNELKITYDATTDKPTPINLTHHSYFNLHGAGNGTILDHRLLLLADNYTPVDTTMIPTGEIVSVKNTPFDFTVATEIGKNIDADNQQLKNAHGYDHNWVLNNQEGIMALAARIVEPKSGRTMEVYTTEPGMQFYTSNFLNEKNGGKEGRKYAFRTAFCLEPQHYPDSPNQKSFPTTIVRPGENYHTETVYKFGIE